MKNTNVPQDTTLEGEQDSNLETESKTAEELQQELDKANELANNYKIRAEKAEKASKAKKSEKSKTPKKTEKSDEPNVNDRLDELTLKSDGITNQDDINFVKSEAKKVGKTVNEILQFDYIKETLKKNKTQREAEDGMPDGSGKSGGGTKDKVSYWIDRKDKDGAYENPPDHDLAVKVINARMEKERKKLEFPE